MFDYQQKEKELRAARRDVFSDDPAVAEKAAQDIVRLKAELAPHWNARQTPESAYARVMWM